MRKYKNVICVAAVMVGVCLIAGCQIDALPDGVTEGVRNGVSGLIEQIISAVGEGATSGM